MLGVSSQRQELFYSNRIHEEVLNAAVQSYIENTLEQYAMELKQLAKMQKMWALRKPTLDTHILSLMESIQVLEHEIDQIYRWQVSFE